MNHPSMTLKVYMYQPLTKIIQTTRQSMIRALREELHQNYINKLAKIEEDLLSDGEG
jgi:ABC-type polysaccharide/polyol phosphate export permease